MNFIGYSPLTRHQVKQKVKLLVANYKSIYPLFYIGKQS